MTTEEWFIKINVENNVRVVIIKFLSLLPVSEM